MGMEIGLGQSIVKGNAAAAKRWTPEKLIGNGLGLWIDAPDLSTITKDGSNVVSQVLDKSGNSRTASAGSGSVIWDADAVEGKPAFIFDGSSSLDLASVWTTNQATIFIVGYGDNGHILADSTGNNRIYDGHITTGAGALDRDLNASLATDKGSVATFFHVAGSPGSSFGRVNGIATGNATVFNDLDIDTIGGVWGSGGAIPALTGAIAEIIIVENALATTDIRDKIEKYAADKYRTYNANADWRASEYGTYLQGRIDTETWNASDVPAQLFLFAGQSNILGQSTPASLWDAPYTGIMPGMKYMNPLGFTEDFEEGENFFAGNTIGPFTTTMYGLKSTFPRQVIYGGITGLGGSTIAVDWASGASLYNAAISRFNNAISRLKNNYGYKTVELVLVWGQGEGDGGVLAYANNYDVALADLYSRFRADITDASSLKIVMMRLSDNQTAVDYLSTIQGHQDTVAAADANVHIVNTDALTMQSDNLHFDVAGYTALGNAYASQIASII